MPGYRDQAVEPPTGHERHRPTGWAVPTRGRQLAWQLYRGVLITERARLRNHNVGWASCGADRIGRPVPLRYPSVCDSTVAWTHCA